MRILPEGRYEVELPWNSNLMNLCDNKELAWKRHEKMINKLKCGNFFDDYQNFFREWESMNIIERVPEIELNYKCHYLPHRPVIKLNSQTTKVRPVFDASASQRGKLFLNECLHKGVNLPEMIPDILDRFRMFLIGISADIEKAFLMLSVAPKDRDFLRFFSPGSEGQEIYGHCQVVFGVCSSLYLLNISLIHLLENCPTEFKEIAQKMKRSFYVDNLVCGVYNISELEHFIEQAKCIMNKGFFNLRGFESNVDCKNVDKHSGDTSVLGIIWNLDNDILKCCVDLEPLTCEGAYAACVFVRSIIDSKVNIVLARAKSRVAPLKPLIIPRLELMACNVGARLVNSLMKALNFPNLKITFWSDSTIALWWIKEQGNWSVFVSNRVKEIRLLTKTHSWKPVPGNMNPADLLSRGCYPYKLLKSKWWEGPA
ncbi:DUF1758 domain-containing protein [Trichonephila clavipes]|uniref:DUF1758 domain-containing protein n=1 Tax=Trichonephila clavipes TaxID=2585209 RepID=A0A8X6VJM0_TRICX|nr:DUF1758 domain-containing protein [Trichonephila clavipes]